ncbi:hypothetical protein [Bacillus subtilis]|uniref:hypothetical protein n=1 Tax=Bacillus subtilis TaxID=1423 RepID=UPI00119C92A1|nr:hypothetical protein [Bacillus subtilis]
MSEQLSIFELEPYENNVNTVNHDTAGLEQIGFSHILPLGVDKQGRAGYRAVYEGKGCTVNIDDGHVMIKHDDSRFWVYIGNYIRD